MIHSRTKIALTLLAIAGITISVFFVFSMNSKRHTANDTQPTTSTPQNTIQKPTETSTETPHAETKTPEPTVEEVLPPLDMSKKILHDVPFTPQAPSAQWDIQIFQDGCEEASVIMAIKWARGESKLKKSEAERLIEDISNFEMENYGFNLDVSTRDTFRMINEYYDYTNIELIEQDNVSIERILTSLYSNELVILPVNGKALGNPYFSDGGPDNHMLVVIGYDPKKEEFITHEPGSRRGKEYRYHKNILFNAIADYPSGYHEPNPDPREKLMIVVRK